MRPLTLAYFYLRRLRTHPVQELLAGVGIAIGVALTCAVQIANHSVTGSAAQTVRELGGEATLQLAARSARGVPQRIVEEARRLPAVETATGLLEQRAVVRGPNGRSAPVHLVGARLDQRELGGLLPPDRSIAGIELGRGIVLPRGLADMLDARPDTGSDRVVVRVSLRGRIAPVEVVQAPGPERVGAFANGSAALMPRLQLQEIARLPGRVTRILVRPRPGQAAAARRQLVRLTDGTLSLGRPTDELRLLAQATGPSDRASSFFTLIAATVGWLLAFNAMLLSAPERRRAMAELRLQGYRYGQLVQIALFQAAALGVVASSVGLAIGVVLARDVLAESADYLANAFSFGSQTVVPDAALILSFAGGVTAACLAAAPPLLALRRREALGAAYGDAPGSAQMVGRRRRWRLAVGALVAIGVAVAQPRATAIVAILALTVGLLLALPVVVTAIVEGMRALTSRTRLTMGTVGLLMAQPTTIRSLALAATAALAVFGSVAVSSARQDLLRGIAQFSERYAGSADLWVVHPTDNQTTKDFPADALQQRLAQVPDVAAVRPYRGGYLDVAGRRAWVIAHAPGTPEPIPRTEIVGGRPAMVPIRLSAGGWLTLSDHLAEVLDTGPGGVVELPTPRGRVRYRVAATTTNFGWSSGAIVLSASDYERDWGSPDVTGLELDLRPGVSASDAAASVHAALGPHSALEVKTARERMDEANASASQGLERLGQIAALLIVGAAMAMAAAIGASIWQRRVTLAALRLQGLRPVQLWRAVLAEDGTILIAGSLAGALAGLYGQLLIDRYLQHSTGFSAPYLPGAGPVVSAFGLLIALVLLALALPAYLAARTPTETGLRESAT